MNYDLTTKEKITWCPGCPDFAILVAFRKVISDLVDEKKLQIENLVIGAGIGCHGKIADYLNLNSFTSLHGRIVPTMTGVKLANSKLTVMGFSGDGDAYAEGIEHLVHAARRNSDIKLFIHDNRVFALTTGQSTPTSPKGFKGKSTPDGNPEEPFNPLLLMLSAGATFIARSYAGDIEGTKKMMRAAIEHKGFALLEIIQPCITFFDTRDYFKERIYWLDDTFPTDNFEHVIEKMRTTDDKVPLGIFYDVTRPTFEESLNQ